MLHLKNRLKKPAKVRKPSSDPIHYFETLSGYARSPVVSLRNLANRPGCKEIFAKLESDRFGLQSFKVLGAAWALQNLRARGKVISSLVTATDGNHGKAVARLARRDGISSVIFIPQHCAVDVKLALENDGASVTRIAGNYDDSVEAAQRHARELGSDAVLLSDTSHDKNDEIANWMIEGYGAIFSEWSEQKSDQQLEEPEIVIIQIGVGGLAAAAAQYFRHNVAPLPRLIGVEPLSAAAALRSAEAGTLVRVDASEHTDMVGLNAGLISAAAWSDVKYGFDEFIAVADEYCGPALRALTADGVTTKPTGASPVAGLLALAGSNAEVSLADKRVLLIVSEGADVM